MLFLDLGRSRPRMVGRGEGWRARLDRIPPFANDE